MKVLVTGPDGLLGSNLVRELISREYEVSAFTENGQKSATIAGLNITKTVGNILNIEELINATNGIDVVIHCAASTNMYPPRTEMVNRVNIGGTENVILACQKNKVKRLIYVGTANSFRSGDKKVPGNEMNEYAAGHYGLDYMDSKYKAQLLVLEKVKTEGLNAIVVNPTFMIGPYDSRPSSGEMIRAVHNKKVPGYAQGGKNFVAVKDVAVAIANAITKGEKGNCYILGNENLSYKEAFLKIAKCMAVKPPKLMLSKKVVRAYGKGSSIFAGIFKFYPKITHELAILSTENHFYSSKKAIDELEMPQTPIEHAIIDCYDWFIENNYLIKK
ncbi:MAG: NAD-dependent epimerase/dehydratase family protein [Crocinitomicaceae bacterium]